jgi:hypothetical protein
VATIATGCAAAPRSMGEPWFTASPKACTVPPESTIQ